MSFFRKLKNPKENNKKKKTRLQGQLGKDAVSYSVKAFRFPMVTVCQVHRKVPSLTNSKCFIESINASVPQLLTNSLGWHSDWERRDRYWKPSDMFIFKRARKENSLMGDNLLENLLKSSFPQAA